MSYILLKGRLLGLKKTGSWDVIRVSSDLSDHSGLSNHLRLSNHLSSGIASSCCGLRGLLISAELALSLHLAVDHDLVSAAEPNDAEDCEGKADDDSNDDSDNCTCGNWGSSFKACGCSGIGIAVVSVGVTVLKVPLSSFDTHDVGERED